MCQRRRQRSAVALATRNARRADDGSQGSGLQRDGERLEAATAEPDERGTEGQKRNPKPRACEAREEEQPFGVHATQESHCGSIRNK